MDVLFIETNRESIEFAEWMKKAREYEKQMLAQMVIPRHILTAKTRQTTKEEHYGLE